MVGELVADGGHGGGGGAHALAHVDDVEGAVVAGGLDRLARHVLVQLVARLVVELAVLQQQVHHDRCVLLQAVTVVRQLTTVQV